jgi:cytochrome c oxidase subunit 2
MPSPESTIVVRPSLISTPTPDANVLIEQGETLANDLDCLGCHSTDGREQVGPTWKGVFGSMERLESGQAVVVDETYIRKSIRQPNADIVEGFFDLMPGTFTTDEVSDEEIDSIIEFIRSLQ